MKLLSAVVGLVLVVSAFNVRQKGSACSLLTAAEIEGIVGAKVGEARAGAQGAATGCTWPVQSDRGALSVSVAPLPPGTTATGLAKKNAGMDALRKAKYTFEEKDYANAYCAIASPPASQKDGVFLSSCGGGAPGTVVSLVYTSPTKKLTLVQVKSLLDKGVSRQR